MRLSVSKNYKIEMMSNFRARHGQLPHRRRNTEPNVDESSLLVKAEQANESRLGRPCHSCLSPLTFYSQGAQQLDRNGVFTTGASVDRITGVTNTFLSEVKLVKTYDRGAASVPFHRMRGDGATCTDKPR
jgi:hypothetical protein